MEPSSSDRLLEVRNLKVHFEGGEKRLTAVDDVSFHIDKGETLAIVGESGSGKSITSLSIMGLVPKPSGKVSGQIVFDGRDLLALPERAMRDVRGNRISMIFQEPMTSLNPVYRIGDQIVEAVIQHQRKSRAEARELAIRMLELVEMPEPRKRIDYFPHQISGGQRQRVMIAMALSSQPSLIIADEPTTALDVIIQAQILDLIRKLQRETQVSILFITHDLGVVAEIADRVLVMQKGKIVESGTVREVFLAPKHPYTQKLLSAVPRIDMKKATPVARSKPPTLVEVRDLCKWFPIKAGFFQKIVGHTKAVTDLSLDIRRGEVLGLVGESGSGKTTAGRTILRLLEPTSGEISFDGVDVRALSSNRLRRFRRRMQIIFQDPYGSLNRRMTVGDILAEPLVLHGICSTRKERNRRIAELLELVQLDVSSASRYPHEFSGGQRQRIGIARALAVEPEFIVADECVSALDVSIRREVLNLIKDLRSRFNLTLLFISHDLAVVEDISDRVAVMYGGELVELQDAYSVYRSPKDDYTKALLAAVPIPDPTVQRVSVPWNSETYKANRRRA